MDPATRSDRKRSRPGTAAVAVAALSLSLAWTGQAAHAQPEPVPAAEHEFEVIDHGIALESVNASQSNLHTLRDGREIAYVFNSGQPVSLSVVDLHTGDLLDRHEMEGYSVTAGHVVDEENDLFYFSVRSPNDGTLFRYDPHAQEVTQLATRVVGEDFLRSMLMLDGILYGTTYPNAKVYSYDPATGDIHDYGTVDEQSAYAWGFEEIDGKLWVGTGTNPTLREVDPQSGEITDIPLPAHIQESKDFVHEIARHDDLVFVRTSPSGTRNLAIYDLQTQDWCCEDVGLMGTWSQDSHDGAFYYIVGSEVRGYDLQERTDFSIGWQDSDLAGEQSGSHPLQLVELDDEDYPGVTLMAFRADGAAWFHNLQTGAGQVVEYPIQGAAATIQSLGLGPDGNPYVGPYLSSGLMSRLDHQTGELEGLNGPDQGDAIATVGDHLVVGTYSGAGFHAGDVSADWDWGTNPEQLFSIGREAGQDRVSDLVDADGLAVGATIPNYGELGGALVIFDPAGGEPQVHRNVVPDHSVVSLAYQDGLIYAGTSIHGGIDSTPASGPAELFVWDVQAQELVDSVVPDESADIIHTLTFDDQGRLWGMTDAGTMFEFDPDERRVVNSVATGLRNSNIWGRVSEMAQSPVDGLIYGNAASRLFTFDPDTHDFTLLEPTGVRYSAVHEDGTFYFTDRTNLFSLVPAGTGRVCDETITGRHNGGLEFESGSVCIQDADLRGGVEIGTGAAVVITDSSVRGPVSVTGAEQVLIRDSQFRGPVSIDQATATVELRANEVRGPVTLTGAAGETAPVVSGNEIRGPLRCADNAVPPTDDGVANQISGPALGQCSGW